MEDNDRTKGEERTEPQFDRRRGPRRTAEGPVIPTDDRRRTDRRNTPGYNALLDDILHKEIEPERD